MDARNGYEPGHYYKRRGPRSVHVARRGECKYTSFTVVVAFVSHSLCVLYIQPAEFCRANFNAEKGKDYDQEIKFMKGTTTLGFRVRPALFYLYLLIVVLTGNVVLFWCSFRAV
jgi:hypothetical protein